MTTLENMVGETKGKNPLLIFNEHFHIYKAFIESHISQFFEAKRWKHFHFREENSVLTVGKKPTNWAGKLTFSFEFQDRFRSQPYSSVRVNYQYI